MLLSLPMWVILGLAAGFATSATDTRVREGAGLDLVIGIAGAVVGGWFFTAHGVGGVAEFNLYSPIAAFATAIFLLALYHATTATDTH